MLTYKSALFKKIPLDYVTVLDEEENRREYLEFGAVEATVYNLIELAGNGHVKFIPEMFYLKK